ncbi:MAG: alpha-amylase family glycosyl hydrolase [Paludibacteraceae bacterium]|nr:alpha-amylase family glycosyl hydrolase [Paludibacteraceae bacterium]
MKKIVFVIALCVLPVAWCLAQVTTDPAIIQKGDTGPVTIIFNPNQGNKGMVGATACYAHTGYNSWVGAPTWRSGLDKHKMTKNADGNWELKMPDGLYAYYGITPQTNVTQLCFVFNDGKGSNKEGKTAAGGDIFVKLAESGLQVQITSDMAEVSVVGDAVTLTCNATEAAELTLTQNGQTVKTGSGEKMVYTGTLSTTGTNTFELTASSQGVTKTTQLSTYVSTESPEEARPTGLKMGITYDSSNPTAATFCTYAASCKTANDPSVLAHAKTVYIVGSFNQWKVNDKYQMKRDGNYFWLKKTGLAPGTEHTYQYLVVRADGKVVRISDLYSTRVKEGVSGADGYASILQTQVSPYKWSEATLNFKRPNKNNLVIYELWVYDHTANKNLKGLLSRLDYFEELGVNCIELMPVHEFDGDQSWGYSPNHYFAVDKQYGQPNDLKIFVDSCHKRGIAVVLDLVLNHSTGNNPMNKLHHGDELKYNPWFNVTPPHPDNVYEDWNHDFGPTHQMMIDVLKFWMEEYKVDGYRLDLSHGLCGKSYNAVTNLTDYYTKAVQPLGGYMMLEHWGGSMGTDRPKLVNAGMMCWENTCNAFEQVAMGWLKDGDDLSSANKDNYISYSENHDEERCFFKAKRWGNGTMQTSEAERIARIPLVLGFQAMLNGPQLFYHFAEVGSEIGKFQSKSGTIGKEDGENPPCAYSATSCQDYNYKMEPKEIYRMTWTQESEARQEAMRQVGKIIRLRTRIMPKVFEGNPTTSSVGAGKSLRTVQWGNNVFVAGNFSATATATVTLPAGTWYDYMNDYTPALQQYTLQPGEIKIFTFQSPTELPEQETGSMYVPHKILHEGHLYFLHDNRWTDLWGNTMK